MQVSNNKFMIIFGAFQLLLSQIPDFDRLWFLSVVAAVMSFSYASIGFGLAVGKATGMCNLTQGDDTPGIIFSAPCGFPFPFDFFLDTQE